ncbi:MAG: type transport system ATP-binding protein [Chthoniobacter sp.]|nr:type transport system ATP-binding protein [Chthoniobacter sp.]
MELAGISKIYGRTRALNRVRLEFAAGRIVAVVGLNGAGKTTLLLAIAGLLGLSEGDVYFDDELFRRNRVDLRRRFFFLPDFPIFFGHFTVLQHLGMVARIYEQEDAATPERAIELLRAFDLLALANEAVGTLSRGQLYKAALVGLLLVSPELWLIDEPLASGMDPLGLREFKQRARAAAAAGSTVIYSTQILPVAEQFSDEIVLLHRGEVHAHGPLAQVLAAQHDQNLEALFAGLREEA